MIKKIKAWYRNKKMYDYKTIRNEKIRGYEKIADLSLFFYYDETENFGKMRINLNNEFGYNIRPDSPVFMVGGIWCRYEITNAIAQELIDMIKVKSGLNEIKFNNVFGRKHDIKGILKNGNLDIILDWLEKYDICFHFIEYNIWTDITNDLYQMLPGELLQEEKDVLKKLVFAHSKDIAILLDEVKYPNIIDNKMFWDKMVEILELDELSSMNNVQSKSIEDLCVFYEKKLINGLKQKMQAVTNGRVTSDKCNIEKGILTEDLSITYLLPTIIYKNSMHFFDNENVIKEKLEDDIVYIGKKRLANYKFVNVYENKKLISEEIKAVYICDWVIRILHQMLQYLRENGYEKLYPYLQQMTGKEKNRFIRLCKIIQKSKERNPFSFCFFDISSVPYRFDWLINFEETLIKAQLYNTQDEG